MQKKKKESRRWRTSREGCKKLKNNAETLFTLLACLIARSTGSLHKIIITLNERGFFKVEYLC